MAEVIDSDIRGETGRRWQRLTDSNIGGRCSRALADSKIRTEIDGDKASMAEADKKKQLAETDRN